MQRDLTDWLINPSAEIVLSVKIAKGSREYAAGLLRGLVLKHAHYVYPISVV